MSTSDKSRLTNVSLVVLSVLICLVLVEGASYVVVKTGGTGNYERDFENSLGLRDPRDPADLQGKSVILALGDSFTYGWGVKYEESFPAQLEASLRSANLDIAVVNGGTPGFDTQMAFDRLRKIYEHYKPVCVVLGFHSADVPQNQIAFRALNNAATEQTGESANDQGLETTIKQRETNLPILYLIKEFVRKHSNTGAVVNYFYKNYLIKYLPPPEAITNIGHSNDFESSEYFLDQINDYLSEKDTTLAILSIVPLVRFDAYPYVQLNDRLREYSESRGVSFVNPLEGFSGRPSSELWVSVKDGHYNSEGNRLVSDVLREVVFDRCTGT